MLFILFTPSHYHPLFCMYLISLLLRCSCYPPSILHFHVSIFHVCAPCLPLLPFSPSPQFGLSLLRFSILQLLNQYLPHWKPQALFFSGRTPEWASQRGIWQADRQKKRNEPRKDTADSSLRWAEVSFVLFKLKTERDQKQNICAITRNVPQRNTSSPEASLYVNLHIDKHGAKPLDVPLKK